MTNALQFYFTLPKNEDYDERGEKEI